jgi:hypothetical protein
MGKQFDEITPDLRAWIAGQRIFFVATAPRSDDGLLNCSPKGLDAFRILGPREVGYLDLTGSGIETAAHLNENGRIVFMFCAFDGPPRIVRLHGTGTYYTPSSAEFREVESLFPALPGTRGIVRARLSRIADSCGWGVPRFDFAGERDTLIRYAEQKGPVELANYRTKKNLRSIDGLRGLEEGNANGRTETR